MSDDTDRGAVTITILAALAWGAFLGGLLGWAGHALGAW